MATLWREGSPMGRHGPGRARWRRPNRTGGDGADTAKLGDDALRRLPASDWVRLWANCRAKHLPESVAREVQLSITSFSLDVTTFITSSGLVATTVILVTLVPLSTPLGKLWMGLQSFEYSMVFVSIWYLKRSRRKGTLSAAQFNRFLIVPTVIGGVFWGGLPAVVGTESLEMFYLALMISALACSVGYFWTLGHWPLSMIFAAIILSSLMVVYSSYHETGSAMIVALGPLLFLTMFGISIMAQVVLVRSSYFEAVARDREQQIGLILDDYERHGQDFLWETDSGLRFSHVPVQMEHAGRGDPRIAFGASLRTLLRAQPEALRAVRKNEPFDVRVVTYGHNATGEVRLWGRPKIVQGKTLGYHGIGCDQDAIRRAAETERTNERLDAMVALTSGLAHDFNNQLATVLGAVELAAMGPNLPETTLGFLNRAVDACLRTRRITADLVVASGYDATYQPGTFDAGIAVADVAADLAPLFPDVEIEVVHDQDAWAIADRDHYMRAVRNLMQNACQAVAGMPLDDRRVTAEVTRLVVESGPAFVATRVCDTGPGVPADMIERIFDPFSTTRRDRGGTGLGLSVARGFAHQAGGRLTLEPTLRGAVFQMLIPLADAPAPGWSDRSPDRTEAVVGSPVLMGRFLVVDDDHEVADNVAQLVRAYGGSAEVAFSVAEAIEKFAGHTADVECVISDLALPDGEGYEVIAALRQHDPELPAIYMSGFTRTLPADVGADLQCPFLAKPFSAAELLGVLEATDAPSESGAEGASDPRHRGPRLGLASGPGGSA